MIIRAEFDAERYRAAMLKRFDKLNFDMIDTTGAYYQNVRLWSVFVPQSARECHQYNPRLLEIPKEHQRRLLDAGSPVDWDGGDEPSETITQTIAMWRGLDDSLDDS